LLEEEMMGVDARKQSQYKLVAEWIHNFYKRLIINKINYNLT
jgi:hypothetical protein